jgi:hypothetical protein
LSILWQQFAPETSPIYILGPELGNLCYEEVIFGNMNDVKKRTIAQEVWQEGSIAV